MICSMCEKEISDDEWQTLPSIGTMIDGDGGMLELKNHVCGSTLSRPIVTSEHKPAEPFCRDDRCCVCTGHEDVGPCSEECERIAEMAARRRGIRAMYVAARRALRLARLYVREVGYVDERADQCLLKVIGYRHTIAMWRSDMKEDT